VKTCLRQGDNYLVFNIKSQDQQGLTALGISRWRILLVNTVITLLTLCSLSAILMGELHAEPWPFSNYPMYSETEREYSYTRKQAYGVTQEEPPREIPLGDL
jgi:hypothetical protein